MTADGAARFVGRSVARREDPRMLSGRGRYIADVWLPGMLHASFVRSAVARGRIVSIDTAAARAHPGVHAVFTAADFAGYGPMHSTLFAAAPAPPARPLATTDVRFVGDAVAIVVARDLETAEDAAALVDVVIEPDRAVIDPEDALEERAIVHAELGTNVAGRHSIGDDAEWEAIRASAAHVVTRTFTQARATHVPMEPRGLVVSWDRFVPELSVWSSTQNTHEVRAFASRFLGVPEHHVRAMSGDVGGGFGMKIFVTPDEAAVMAAAHKLGRPVRWIEDRRENLMASAHARADEATCSMAVNADGLIVGVRVEHREDVGAFPVGGTGSSVATVARLLPGPYRLGPLFYRGVTLYTNTCGRAAYRGPWLMETVIREQMLDHVAREIGVDPLHLRRRHTVPTDEFPHQLVTGMSVHGVTPAETLEQVAQLIRYSYVRRRQASQRADNTGPLVGLGLACFVEPNGMGAGLLGSDQASVRITPGGKVDVALGTGSTGNSLETTIAQIVADHLGCSIDDVVFRQGDTAATPWGHGSGGSRAAVVSGGAAREASLVLREQVLAVAATLLEAAPEDLDAADGVVSVRGTPSRQVTFAQVAQFAFGQPERMPADRPQGLEVTLRYKPPTPYTWSNASHACVVEIDRATGVVTVVDYAVSEDCGVLINPMVVEGQIAGGVVQGIGGALLEHAVYDDAGNPLCTTFLDYLLPTAADAPTITYGHIETPSATSGGYKGMGEGGAIGAPAAVANAVADALAPFGLRDALAFPLSPDRVLPVIVGAGAGAGAGEGES